MRYVFSLFIVAVCTTAMRLSATFINADGHRGHFASTSGPRGADGVDLADVNGDGRQEVTSAWEQAGIVTVSLHPGGAVSAPWPTVTVGTKPGGVKDAIFADVDHDGQADVPVPVSASACKCRRVVIHFAPRDGSAWTYTQMSPVGWTMSVLPLDVDNDKDFDVALSDRLSINNPDGTISRDLRGSRWLKNTNRGASLSGVVMLAATPNQNWERVEISGPPGTKYDNVQLYDVDGDRDLDVMRSERVDQLGVIWYGNPAR